MSRIVIVTGFIVSAFAAAQSAGADESARTDAAKALAMTHTTVSADLSHSAKFMFETFSPDYALATADQTERLSAAEDSRTALGMSRKQVGKELGRNVDFLVAAPNPSGPTLGVAGEDELVAGALDAPDSTGGI